MGEDGWNLSDCRGADPDVLALMPPDLRYAVVVHEHDMHRTLGELDRAVLRLNQVWAIDALAATLMIIVFVCVLACPRKHRRRLRTLFLKPTYTKRRVDV